MPTLIQIFWQRIHLCFMLQWSHGMPIHGFVLWRPSLDFFNAQNFRRLNWQPNSWMDALVIGGANYLATLATGHQVT
jgi:hypothetical protein